MKHPATKKKAPKTDGIERRASTRITVPLQIEILPSRKGQQAQRITVSDISGGGLKLFSDKAFKKNEPLTINIFLPQHPRPVRIKAKVVWCAKMTGDKELEGYALGIKFIKIPPSDQERFIFALCDLTVRQAVLQQTS